MKVSRYLLYEHECIVSYGKRNGPPPRGILVLVKALLLGENVDETN